jgi:hypothetical protein
MTTTKRGIRKHSSASHVDVCKTCNHTLIESLLDFPFPLFLKTHVEFDGQD